MAAKSAKTKDDKGTATQHPRHELPDLKDRPTPGLLMLAGLLLGMMFCWLVGVILFGGPDRYSGLRPEVMLMLVIGGVVGLVLGGFLSVMTRSQPAARARR